MILPKILRTTIRCAALGICIVLANTWGALLAEAEPSYPPFPDISRLEVFPINNSMHGEGPPGAGPHGVPLIGFETVEGVSCDMGDRGVSCQSHNPLFLTPDQQSEAKPGKCLWYDYSFGHDLGTSGNVDCASDPVNPFAPYILPDNHKITFDGVTCGKIYPHTLACTDGKYHLVMQPGNSWTDNPR